MNLERTYRAEAAAGQNNPTINPQNALIQFCLERSSISTMLVFSK